MRFGTQILIFPLCTADESLLARDPEFSWIKLNDNHIAMDRPIPVILQYEYILMAHFLEDTEDKRGPCLRISGEEKEKCVWREKNGASS